MVGQRVSDAVRQQGRAMHKAGHSFAHISRQLRISAPTAKMHALRTGSTADLPRSGRPRATTPALRKAMKRKARAGCSVKKIKTSLAAKKGVNVSESTVAGVLKGGRKPLTWLPVTRARLLREANKNDRVLFCTRHGEGSWHDTVFIDSKYLYVNWDQARGLKFCWQYASNPMVVPQQSNMMVFHFYAAVAHGHKSMLVFVPPTRGALGLDPKEKVTFKSCHFVAAMKVLSAEFKKWFPQGSRYRVVFDHARQHTSQLSRRELAEMNIPVMHDFPAQCWDINVIEVAWAFMMEHLRGHNPRTRDGWQRAIKMAWKKVDITLINNLVDYVTNQLQRIIEKQGEWVKYYS